VDHLWKNYSRVFIPCEELLRYCDLADECGDGHIFHHRYVNACGDFCERLSPENTVRVTKYFKMNGRMVEVR